MEEPPETCTVSVEINKSRNVYYDARTYEYQIPTGCKKKVILHALSAYSAIVQCRKHVRVHAVKARGGMDVLLHAFSNLGIRLI